MSAVVPAGRRPDPASREVRDLIALARDVGHTSGGIAMGLMDEFELALRERPHEVAMASPDPVRELAERIAGEIAHGDVERRCLLARAWMLAAELAGPDMPPAETSLAAAAALAWLDWTRCVSDREALPDDCPLSVYAYHDGRVDRAHRRYIRSVKAVVAVRKLGLPSTAIQINVGARPGREESSC